MAYKNIIYFKIINPALLLKGIEIFHFDVHHLTKNSYEVKLFNEFIEEPFSIILNFVTDHFYLNDYHIAKQAAQFLSRNYQLNFQIKF